MNNRLSIPADAAQDAVLDQLQEDRQQNSPRSTQWARIARVASALELDAMLVAEATRLDVAKGVAEDVLIGLQQILLFPVAASSSGSAPPSDKARNSSIPC